jgi:pyridoxamine 5'-phosphate oxidase family protein
MAISTAAVAYLASQPLGRLATVAPNGTPQVSPVGFRYDADLGVIDIGGHNLAASKKFRNIEAGSKVAFVVDDIESFQPWRVRGVEIRGTAEALHDHEPPMRGMSREVIRVHLDRVIEWGL